MEHSRESWTQVVQAGFDWSKLLKGQSLPEAVMAAQIQFVEHVEKSPQILEYLTQLPKGAGTCCPDSPVEKLVRYLAARRETVNKDNPQVTLDFIRELVMPAMEFEHTIACEAARRSSDATLTEFIFLEQGADMANLLNQLWLKWFAAVVVPYQSLPEGQRPAWDKVFEEQLPKYDYTVFGLGSDHTIIDRQSWALAFPKEIQAICSSLASLKQALLEVKFDQPETLEFLDALIAAYACTEIGQLEEFWANVDRAWVVIPPDSDCRTLMVYGMESGYEHPRCVSPELRIDTRTTFGQELIEDVRADIIAFTEKKYPASLQLLLQKLGYLDVAIFAQTIAAGVQCDFRYLGQAVPNRQDIMSNIGGRIFVDKNGLQSKTNTFHRLISKHCALQTVNLLKGLLDSVAVNRFVQGHEHAHPVARTPESDAALGEAFRLLEECKASTYGELAAYEAHPESAPTMVAHFIGRLLQLLDKDKMADPTFAAYVRDALVHANLMLDSGVIAITPEGISVNFDNQGIGSYFEALAEFMAELICAYQTSNGETLKTLASQYCDRGEGTAVAELIAWINRPQ